MRSYPAWKPSCRGVGKLETSRIGGVVAGVLVFIVVGVGGRIVIGVGGRIVIGVVGRIVIGVGSVRTRERDGEGGSELKCDGKMYMWRR